MVDEEMSGEEIGYEIGPLAAASARAWIKVSRANLAAILEAEARAPFRIPPEVAVALDSVLEGWERAAQHDPFVFGGAEDPDRARVLLTYWLNIVSLTAAQGADLGVVEWPIEAAEFEQTIERAIITALGADERLRRIRRARRTRL